MLAKHLASTIAPMVRLSNKNALSAAYKALLIGPKFMRACSSWGVIEVNVSPLPDNAEPFYVEASTFLAVVRSLPEDSKIEMCVEDQVLVWSCGSAKGRLALMMVDKYPTIDHTFNRNGYVVGGQLYEGLRFGALSCGAPSLASAGTYGVGIRSLNGEVQVYACDNTTISHAAFKDTLPEGDYFLTPEAVALLTDLFEGESHPRIDFVGQSIFYRDSAYTLHVKQLEPMKADILKQISNFSMLESTMPIDATRVDAFIRRASAMSSKKDSVDVILGIEDGRMTLAFSDGAVSSDEYYLVEGLETGGERMQVTIDAIKLARALGEVDTIGLDFIDRHVIVLMTESQSFRYMISGRQNRA